MTTDLEGSEDGESGGYTGWIVGAFVLAMIFVFGCSLYMFGPKRNQKSVTEEDEVAHPSKSSSACVSEMSGLEAIAKCVTVVCVPGFFIAMGSCIISWGVANMNEAAMWEESATITNCTVLDRWTESCYLKFRDKIGWRGTRSDHRDIPYIFNANSKQC